MANRKTNSRNKRRSTQKRTNSRTTPNTRRRPRTRGRRKRRRSNFRLGRFLLLIVVTIFAVVVVRNDFDFQNIVDDFRNFNIFELFSDDENRRPEVTFSDDFYAKAEYLAFLYPEGREVVYLDVMTIRSDDWMYERLDIGGHDHLDRTLPVIAYLSERNLGVSEARSSQTHNPTGWDQNQLEIDGSEVWVKNRGHLIAYTLTFNFNEDGQFVYGYLGSEDDPANLFTQTAHSNQNIMTRYEAQIRGLLADGKEVVFKSAPIFRDDELMARGIWLQAISTCDEFLLSVFIFNEQPGVVIDHATGENWVDE